MAAGLGGLAALAVFASPLIALPWGSKALLLLCTSAVLAWCAISGRVDAPHPPTVPFRVLVNVARTMTGGARG